MIFSRKTQLYQDVLKYKVLPPLSKIQHSKSQGHKRFLFTENNS